MPVEWDAPQPPPLPEYRSHALLQRDDITDLRRKPGIWARVRRGLKSHGTNKYRQQYPDDLEFRTVKQDDGTYDLYVRAKKMPSAALLPPSS